MTVVVRMTVTTLMTFRTFVTAGVVVPFALVLATPEEEEEEEATLGAFAIRRRCEENMGMWYIGVRCTDCAGGVDEARGGGTGSKDVETVAFGVSLSPSRHDDND